MHRIGAVVLAAGASERFGAENKLLVKIGGVPLIRSVVLAIFGSGIVEVVVVTGFDDAGISSALNGLPARYAHNKEWRSGMGTSVATGIAALSGGIDGAFVVPGDLPRLSSRLLSRLASAFEEGGRRVTVFPVTADGDQRNPVLWPQSYFDSLMKLHGNQGAKALLRPATLECHAVETEDQASLEDIDTRQDLQRMRRTPTALP